MKQGRGREVGGEVALTLLTGAAMPNLADLTAQGSKLFALMKQEGINAENVVRGDQEDQEEGDNVPERDGK